jgi:hypothetical protein
VLAQQRPRRLVITGRNSALIRPDATGADEGIVVPLVLAGVCGGEFGDGPVEHVRAAEVGSDGDPVPGAGVCPRQLPRAQFAIHPHVARLHGLDAEGELPVPQLADVEVAGLAAEPRIGTLPAQEDVAGRLHQPLARDHRLALVGVLAGTGKTAEH